MEISNAQVEKKRFYDVRSGLVEKTRKKIITHEQIEIGHWFTKGSTTFLLQINMKTGRHLSGSTLYIARPILKFREE